MNILGELLSPTALLSYSYLKYMLSWDPTGRQEQSERFMDIMMHPLEAKVRCKNKELSKSMAQISSTQW